MKKSLLIAARATAMCAVVVACVSLAAKDQQQIGNFGDLTLTLAIPDREFLVLEPIPMTISLENRTKLDISGHSVLEFSAGRTTLLVQADGGSWYRVEQLSPLLEFVGIQPRAIRSGEARRITEVFALDLGSALPRPGVYRVRVSLVGIDPKQTIESNVVSIRLREPSGVEEAAQQFIRATGAARYLLTCLDDPPVYPQLVDLMGFADTVFGDHATRCLGEIEMHRGNHRVARDYLSKVAARRDFPLAGLAAESLAKLPAN